MVTTPIRADPRGVSHDRSPNPAPSLGATSAIVWRAWLLALPAVVLACGSRASLDGTDDGPSMSLDSVVHVLDGTCGSRTEIDVSISNQASLTYGTTDLIWSATVSPPFSIVGASQGVVSARSSTTVTVEIGSVTAAHPKDSIDAVLHITSNDPEHSQVDVPLSVVAQGAELVVPSTIDFGETDAASAVPVSVKNLGTLPVELAVAAPKTTDFSVDGLATLTLAPGATGTLAYGFHPTKPGLLVEDLPITVKGAICGTVPKTLQLRGRGFVGDARLSATKLDFGLVDCGTQGAAQTVDLKNVGPAPFAFDAAVGNQGGGYAVAPPSGTVAAGGSVTLTITPDPVTPPVDVLPNQLGNTLSITTDIPKDPPHVVDLVQTPHGASLVVPPSTQLGRRATGLNFSDVSIAVTNIGNADLVALATAEYPQIAGTFLAGAGPTQTWPIVVVSADDVGITQTRPFVVRPANGYPLCKVQKGTATWRGYTRGGGPGSATPQLACVTGAPDIKVFCSGTNTLASQPPFPHATLPVGTFDMAWVHQGPLTLAVGEHGYCLSWYCVVPTGNGTVTFDPGWQGANILAAAGTDGPFQLCSRHSNDSIGTCIGFNSQGTWGTGTTSNLLAQTFTTAMGGVTGVQQMSTSSSAGYAVTSSGSILVAGTKSGGNFGTATVPDGLVPNPVLVDGIFDAVAVQAFPGGACAVRANGAVSCWDTTHPIADRGGFTDALEIAVAGRDDFCVRRALGVVSCWNGISASVVTGVASTAEYIRGTGGAKLVTFQNGAVARIVGGSYVYLPGFEGP